MKYKWLCLLQKLKKPNVWGFILNFVLTFLFCSLSIALAIINPSDVFLQILSYLTYVLAMLNLSYTVYLIILCAPSFKNNLTGFIKKFKIGRKLLEEYGFRTVFFATFGLLFNVAFVIYHVVLAFITDTFFWYISLALYYGLLVILRGGIVLFHRKRESNYLTEIKMFKGAGIILTLLPLCLLVPILQILFLDRAFVHLGLSIFVFATYAFYKIIMAIYNIFRSNKESYLTVQAIRCVGLADALVSIFSLQTALLYAFSDGTDLSIMNVFTGLAVFILTVLIGIYMIIKANKKLKERINL